jgi:glycosyltransferase involved in cell wall biosynthesis
MPAYNSHGTIRESVESALAQTVGELEVIVVDDGSDPPIADALSDVTDDRLRVLRHPLNRGAPAARNTALTAARSPFVSHLDSDDLWEPDYLEAVLPCFDDPEVGLTYTNATLIGHPEGREASIEVASVHPMDSFPKLAEQNPIPSTTATIRTDAVRGVGGYAEWLPTAEDYYLWMNLAAAGWRFAYVHRRLASYRWPQAEQALSWDQRSADRDLLRMYAAFVLRHPLTPGPRRQVRTRAKQELRRVLRRRRPA